MSFKAYADRVLLTPVLRLILSRFTSFVTTLDSIIPPNETTIKPMVTILEYQHDIVMI